MDNLSRLAKRFLEGLHEEGTTETFESLQLLTEQLETKNDPESIEIRLASNIYDFMERFRILENNLRSYVKNSNVKLPSNKLAQLMENTSYDGNSVFKD